MAEEQDKDPEIHVDEDWKSQVQAEKEKLAEETAAGQDPEQPVAESTETDETAETADEAPPEEAVPPEPAAEDAGACCSTELPPASFSLLVSTLATQALILLGIVPEPGTGNTTVHKTQAKHYIEMLGMLEEKTRGNLDDEEKELLDRTLHQLRIIYVDVK